MEYLSNLMGYVYLMVGTIGIGVIESTFIPYKNNDLSESLEDFYKLCKKGNTSVDDLWKRTEK